jgi:myosin-crossreactive antigen
MSLKLREENQVLLSFEILMDHDSIVNDELSLLASNIRRGVINVLDFFLSFLKVYDKRKAHNMISLMLDPRYKSLHIISSFVGREQDVVFVEEYDRKSLYPMLIKCHEHLLLVKLKTNFVD